MIATVDSNGGNTVRYGTYRYVFIVPVPYSRIYPGMVSYAYRTGIDIGDEDETSHTHDNSSTGSGPPPLPWGIPRSQEAHRKGWTSPPFYRLSFTANTNRDKARSSMNSSRGWQKAAPPRGGRGNKVAARLSRWRYRRQIKLLPNRIK
jgi:hypothetical protein